MWSDDVTIASKMESTGEPNFIQISEATRSRLTIDLPIHQTRDLELKQGKTKAHLINPDFHIPEEEVNVMTPLEEKDYVPSFPESEPYVWIKYEYFIPFPDLCAKTTLKLNHDGCVR